MLLLFLLVLACRSKFQRSFTALHHNWTISDDIIVFLYVCVCMEGKPSQGSAGKMPKNNLTPNNNNNNNKKSKSTSTTKALYRYDITPQWNLTITKAKSKTWKAKSKKWKRNEKCRHIFLLHFHAGRKFIHCQLPTANGRLPFMARHCFCSLSN